MKAKWYGIMAGAIVLLAAHVTGWAAEETVATAVYSRIDNGYKREKAGDGSFTPEYYALSNGGRIDGTGRDNTVDRVTYPEVAEIAMRLLARQNYHYAQSKEQAKLLLVLHWGATIAPNGAINQMNIAAVMSSGATLMALQNGVSTPAAQGFAPHPAFATGGESAIADAAAQFDSQMVSLLADNRVRDRLNEQNARVLGYVDDINESNDIRRWAGGGDRYNDLIADVEETRYYFVISAYDFPGLLKQEKKKLLWQTRVSVRSPGNAFDDSMAAMLKSASKYFGQNSGRLIRGEESKGRVEFGDLKFLGEAKEREKSPAKENK